jgi:hypothetical protein
MIWKLMALSLLASITHTLSLFTQAEKGKLFSLSTQRTISKEGCPNLLCHLSVDGFVAANTHFLSLCTEEGRA